MCEMLLPTLNRGENFEVMFWSYAQHSQMTVSKKAGVYVVEMVVCEDFSYADSGNLNVPPTLLLHYH